MLHGGYGSTGEMRLHCTGHVLQHFNGGKYGSAFKAVIKQPGIDRNRYWQGHRLSISLMVSID